MVRIHFKTANYVDVGLSFDEVLDLLDKALEREAEFFALAFDDVRLAIRVDQLLWIEGLPDETEHVL